MQSKNRLGSNDEQAPGPILFVIRGLTALHVDAFPAHAFLQRTIRTRLLGDARLPDADLRSQRLALLWNASSGPVMSSWVNCSYRPGDGESSVVPSLWPFFLKLSPEAITG